MKYALLLVALVFGLASFTASTVSAAEGQREGDRETPAALVMRGMVKSVDLEARTIVLGGERETKFVAAEGVNLADLKAGIKVAVTYTKAGETLTATKVVVAKKPAQAEGDREPDRK